MASSNPNPLCWSDGGVTDPGRTPCPGEVCQNIWGQSDRREMEDLGLPVDSGAPGLVCRRGVSRGGRPHWRRFSTGCAGRSSGHRLRKVGEIIRDGRFARVSRELCSFTPGHRLMQFHHLLHRATTPRLPSAQCSYRQELTTPQEIREVIDLI